MAVGFETPIPPIPPIEENMRTIAGGGLSFGVEFRLLNDEIAGEHMAQHADKMRDSDRRGSIDTSGVSIHVFGPEGHEYLRFDCFDDDPHYHYIDPGASTQRIVGLDVVASGAPLAWSLNCLRERLAPMLTEAGGGHILSDLDLPGVKTALNAVEQTALEVVRSA